MTTKLSIEREANLRAQKKKILQLQRLKYLTGKLEMVDVIRAEEAENKDASFEQGKEENSSDQLCTKKPFAVAYEKISDTSNGSVWEHKRSEKEPFLPVLRSPVIPRRKRQNAEETVEQCQKPEKTDSSKISIMVDNTELDRYTPSVASITSEYHRKTTEIRKKADERRRNVGSPGYRHPDPFNLPSNNHILADNNLQPRRSSSLTELRYQDSTEDFDAQHANTTQGIRSKSEELKARAPYTIAELETASLPQRASSMSSINEACLTRENEDLKFDIFARKQQERLEDNLRRVEQNLDSTFSKLRRYINATNELLETVKLKDI